LPKGAEHVPAHCAFYWISGATATQSNGRAAKQPVSRARACTQGRPRYRVQMWRSGARSRLCHTKITANGSSTKNTPHMSDTPPKSPVSPPIVRKRVRRATASPWGSWSAQSGRKRSEEGRRVRFDKENKSNDFLGAPQAPTFSVRVLTSFTQVSQLFKL
jgi:hypothetical protein